VNWWVRGGGARSLSCRRERLQASRTVLTRLLSFLRHAWLRLIVLRVFRKSHGDAFIGVGEAVADGARHGVLGGLGRIVVHEGDALAVFVFSEADLVKAIKLRKHFLQLLLGYILRDVAHVQGKHLYFSHCSYCFYD